MILYRTAEGLVLHEGNKTFAMGETLDDLMVRPGLHEYLAQKTQGVAAGAVDATKLLAPIGSQEVWAAGVTYLRSRAARMAESKDAVSASSPLAATILLVST